MNDRFDLWAVYAAKEDAGHLHHAIARVSGALGEAFRHFPVMTLDREQRLSASVSLMKARLIISKGLNLNGLPKIMKMGANYAKAFQRGPMLRVWNTIMMQEAIW